MSTIKIDYNPYLLETSLVIGGEAITDGELFSLIANKRMDMWVENILPNIAKRLNNKNFTVHFKGIQQDFEGLKEQATRFNHKENGTIKVEALPGMEKNSPLGKLAELRALADEAESSPVEGLTQTAAISSFRKTLDDTKFEICVVATMSSGKSTLINALLGRDLLPAANEATTAAIARISNKPDSEYFFGNAYKEDKPLVSEFVVVDREKLTEWNKCADKIELHGPLPMAKTSGQGSSQELQLVLVDTPGPNSVGTGHKFITYGAMQKGTPPLILFIIDCTNDLTEDTDTLLRNIAEQMKQGGKRVKDRFIFVANKVDELDPEREDIGKTLDKFATYLEERGIENPRIFPVCSVLPKLIRWSQAGGELTKDETRRLSLLRNSFVEDAEKKLLQYVTVPGSGKRVTVSPSVVAEVTRKTVNATGSNNIDDLAIIHSGLVIIEESIKEYVQKYGLTEKINSAREIFSEALHIDSVQAYVLEKIQDNEEELKKINILLNKIQNKLAVGKEAKQFRTNLNKMSFLETDEYKKELEDTRTSFYASADKLMQNIPQKNIDEDVGKALIETLKHDLEIVAQKMEKDFQGMLDSVVKRQAEKICKDYENFYIQLFENSPEIDHILKNISFELRISLPNFMRNVEYYTATISEKTGTRTVSDSTWWKPWTWFRTREESVYEDKYVINMIALSQDVRSRIFAGFEKAEFAAKKDLKARIKVLAADISKAMDDIDAKALDLINDMETATQNKDIAEQTLGLFQKQKKWLSDFTSRLNMCLDLK